MPRFNIEPIFFHEQCHYVDNRHMVTTRSMLAGVELFNKLYTDRPEVGFSLYKIVGGRISTWVLTDEVKSDDCVTKWVFKPIDHDIPSVAGWEIHVVNV